MYTSKVVTNYDFLQMRIRSARMVNNKSPMTTLEASNLPVLIAHKRGEIDCVPTCTLSTQSARIKQGAQVRAPFCNLDEFMFIALMAKVIICVANAETKYQKNLLS
jgi:hypothetical protein